MSFVVLFGPPAVGKMTVGLELERLTGLRLFHNHMTVDLALKFFQFGEPAFARLVNDVAGGSARRLRRATCRG